jgi:RNA polymerase primary sigma factor
MARSALQSELQLYLRQINEVPLLTADEEKRLGWAIINDNDLQAKETMIKANLRLVIAISKNYVHRGLPISDLIEEGNIGLIRAVEGFDPAQGARFSTYASWWIKQAIKRTLINSVQPIHIPAYMIDLIARWKETNRRLEEEFGRPPSLTEISKAMKIPVRKLQVIRRAMKALGAPAHAPTGENGEAMDFNDLIEDSRHGNPEDHVERREDFTLIVQLLESIDPRDAEVLRLRFGLSGRAPLTLKEIGQVVGLTRERVRQIEVDALRRLQQQLLDDRPTRFLRREGEPRPDGPGPGRGGPGRTPGRPSGPEGPAHGSPGFAGRPASRPVNGTPRTGIDRSRRAAG